MSGRKNFFSINNKMDQKSQNEINYENSFFLPFSLSCSTLTEKKKQTNEKKKM
jgi:hypothetical protein